MGSSSGSRFPVGGGARRQVVHVPDMQADRITRFPEAAKINGFRTVLGVPPLREGAPIGGLDPDAPTERPIYQRQIDLVTTFADQAVIAIENVRLFHAKQARTRELTNTLEQQTATSEILGVVARLAQRHPSRYSRPWSSEDGQILISGQPPISVAAC